MGVLADLVTQAQPALYGGGCTARASAGATWRWQFQLTHPDGSAVDLTTVTGVCKIVDQPGGTVLATFTASGDSAGLFSIELDEATTAALADAAPVHASWYCTLSDGTDVVQMWSPQVSRFTIEPGD